MELCLFAEAETVAAHAARLIAVEARAAVADRGRFVMAVSGGRTPWQMLSALAREELPWADMHVMQVDERIAPVGDADRNLTRLRASLLEHAPQAAECIHPMPVEETDLDAAARRYARLLERLAGAPAVLDLVHLGLGPDGHTASLIPGDPVLDLTDRDVAVTGPYQGRRRMTLSFPILNRARRLLWLVTGADKAAMLPHLLAADPSIPAGRVAQRHALVLADEAAAAAVRNRGQG